MSDKEKEQDLNLSFDVGHSSIGWAVLQTKEQSFSKGPSGSIDVLGCGVVTFRADDCMASARRAYRRQRRHIRSTRQRIERIKVLFEHLGVMTRAELDKPGCAWPWLLSARVLASKSGENPGVLLTWPELWDVLRWYAHNRGYDGNRRWSSAEAQLANEEDSEKEENAKSLMATFGTTTMAETFCRICGIDPLGKKKSCNLAGDKRPKAMNAAFPRTVVEGELRRVLSAHFERLKGVDESLERALLGKDANDKLAWQAIPCPKLKLPKRYQGALLFGQLVPRFDNRIISKCPVTGEKVPSRNCPEFLNFRWAMQLANVRVGRLGDKDLMPLTVAERREIDLAMREQGGMGVAEYKKRVREVTGAIRDNLDTMLMHPDAKDALLLDPVQKLVQSADIKTIWPLLPERLQKRIRGQLRRGKGFTLAKLRKQMEEIGADTSAFDGEVQRKVDEFGTKSRKKEKQVTREDLVTRHFTVIKLSQRAAYSRHLLKKAHAEVMAGKHPKEEGGCLFVTDKMREAQLNREHANQTNNHLVRHRLLMLERLLSDIIKEYAGGNKSRVGKITIEVNRDLREMSGMTAKQKAQELGLRIANHHHVAEKLEESLKDERFNRRKINITAGLIRKARIADDLGWTCPYTGQKFEPKHLVTRQVDKDHIVPRSERASDSLDSLVVTFSAINKWKGKRTAWRFVEEEQGKTVPDLPNLSILSLPEYKRLVESLEAFKGHDDDKRRKKKRKELMLLPSYEEKEFTPRDLTMTSQLVRLGAQALKRAFLGERRSPVVVSLPGSVTGAVRKAWKVLGTLSLAAPQVLDESGDVRKKDEIRGITHLHHALDACVLGLASYFIPNNGRIWELIVKRNPNDADKKELMEFGVFEFDAGNRFTMRDLDNRLKEQIRQRLAEKRVVQHIPARMSGLRVEQNVWGLKKVENGIAELEQKTRAVDGTLQRKKATEKVGKLLGVEAAGASGKLARLKGALVIPDNFGLALDPEPKVIPFHKVYSRISELRRQNGNKALRILRNGQLITVATGKSQGVWTVISTEATGRIRIAQPDIVRRIESPPNYKKLNVTRLIRDGLEIKKVPLTGIACPKTSSA